MSSGEAERGQRPSDGGQDGNRDQAFCFGGGLSRLAGEESRERCGTMGRVLQEERQPAGNTYPEALDEALCYGWIDGVRYAVDATRYKIRFTPRKPRSIWSVVNVRHVLRLKKLGKMAKSGLRAFAAREQNRTGINLLFRTETPGTFGEAQEIASGESPRLGVFLKPGAVVSEDGRILGEQCQAGRNSAATAGGAHRKLGPRAPHRSAESKEQTRRRESGARDGAQKFSLRAN
jgi:hypothetical protein